MTFRAVEVLNNVTIIGAEDTRVSKILLNKYNIITQVQSYHKFNERKRTADFIDTLNSGEDIAVISDAGTPGISDPALVIINRAIEENIKIDVLPGATSLIPAILQSGFYQSGFYFYGYLPDKKQQRKKVLQNLRYLDVPLILFTAPHDLIEVLRIAYEIMGDRKTTVCRELSKLHETIYREKLSFLAEHPEMITLKGEFVLVLDAGEKEKIDLNTAVELLKKYIRSGISRKESVKLVVKETGFPRNKVYEMSLEIDDN